MSRGERLYRYVVWRLCTGLLRILFTMGARVRVVAYDPLPERGGYLLVSNHISHFDPPILGTFLKAKIEWIAMTELFHGPVLEALFRALGVIPVDRFGADRAGIRSAFREAGVRLREGKVIGIFPEGGIRDGAASIVNGAEMKPGAVSLAVMAGAPVLPCVILGSERLYNFRNWLPWRRARIWVAHGAPILPDGAGEAARVRLRDALSREIIRLKDRLGADFGLSEPDLPHSPQQRMAER